MARRNTTPYCNQRKLFYAALSLLLLMFGAYVYFVSASIVHVIVRKEINQEITAVSSRLSELETAYIVAKESIDEEDVVARGFKEHREKVFITRTPTNLVLSRNDEG